MSKSTKFQAQGKRAARTRKRLKSKSDRLRLSVFRSSKKFFAQIIDDQNGQTLASVSPKDLGTSKERSKKITKVEQAQRLGEILAQKAKTKNIKKVVFDRGKYRFHGRVKAFADGARKEGLKF